MNKIHEKLLAIIIIILTLLLILGIIFIYLDTTIIEGYMSPTNYTNNYEIIQEYQNFNLVDSVVDFFTPEIFRSSSYQKKYIKPLHSKVNNYNDSNMVLDNTAIKIRNYTTTSSPDDKGYPLCEEKNYTPQSGIRPDWNDKGVYAMCGDVPVGKWGIGGEGVDRAIVNCNGERRSQYRWGKCSENLSGLDNDITTSLPNDKGYPICQEKTYTPETAIRPDWNDNSVYAMCGDVPVGKWGIGSEGVRQAIINCNNERRSQYRWGKCADIVKDTPICNYFNYSNNNTLRDDWSTGGYYPTCDGMPIGKADRQNNLIEEKKKCIKQAAQGRWGKCSNSKYSKHPTCNVDSAGKIAITCNSNYDERPMKIGYWLNNNIVDCANYATRLPNCKDIFKN